MKNLMKLIVIVTMTALLICLAMSFAAADEKIYTSPVFKLPADRVTDWAEGQPDEVPPEETEPEQAGPAETEPEGEQVGETVVEPTPDTTTADNTEAAPAEPVRRVRIFSSQGDVVTEGEIIYLTSSLEGFDGLDITFQWQVDRGDGAGWVNVEGANRSKHSFVASKETIKYSWRLIVNVNE